MKIIYFTIMLILTTISQADECPTLKVSDCSVHNQSKDLCEKSYYSSKNNFVCHYYETLDGNSCTSIGKTCNVNHQTSRKPK
ncbi:MAG TPA: hypothetical protein DCZ80_03400 [Legionellales bacterium]|nr:hypothetical protein [Legionellales bacterium]